MLKLKKWLYPLYCLLILVAYIGLSYNLLVFNDYTWHIKAGEWMIKNKEILSTNIFSWVNPGEFLFTHEWLAEIFMYLFKKIFKYDYLFLVFCLILLFIPLLLIIKKDLEQKNLIATIAISLMLLMVSSTSLFARPFYFGLFFFVLLIKVLDDIKNNKNSKLWIFMPLITILWTNMHGGTAIFAILGPLGYLIGSFFNFNTEKIIAIKGTLKQKKEYIYLLIGNLIATLINPCGIKMFYFSFFINNEETKNLVTEWNRASLDWTTCSIAIAIIFFFLIFNKKQLDFTSFVGLLMFLFLTLIYGRFYSWLAIYFLIVFTKYFNDKNTVFFEKEFPLEVIMILFAVTAFTTFTIITNTFPKPEYEISRNMITTIKENQPERLFNSYDLGGILAYNDIKIFGISDAEAMDESVCWLSKRLESLDINIKYYKEYNFDYFLIEKDSAFYYYAKDNPNEFELIYEDGYTNKELEESEKNFNTNETNEENITRTATKALALFRNLKYKENAEYKEGNLIKTA